MAISLDAIRIIKAGDASLGSGRAVDCSGTSRNGMPAPHQYLRMTRNVWTGARHIEGQLRKIQRKALRRPGPIGSAGSGAITGDERILEYASEVGRSHFRPDFTKSIWIVTPSPFNDWRNNAVDAESIDFRDHDLPDGCHVSGLAYLSTQLVRSIFHAPLRSGISGHDRHAFFGDSPRRSASQSPCSGSDRHLSHDADTCLEPSSRKS